MTTAQAPQTAESYNVHAEEDTFAPTPNWILRRKELSMGAKAAYGRLCQYGGTHGAIWPKMATLAAELGVSESQARRYIQELESFNLIHVHRRGLTLSNTYTLLPHVWQKQEGAQEHEAPETPAAPDLPHVPAPDLSHMQGQLIKKKIEKKTTNTAQAAAKPVVVVSLPDPDEMRKATRALRSDIKATKGIRRTIRQGITEHGLEHILRAIEYTNQNSTRNYQAYLNLAVNVWDIEACQPREKKPAPEPPAPPTAEEIAEMEAKAKADELKRASEKRNRDIFRQLPDEDKAHVIEFFLTSLNNFSRRRLKERPLADIEASNDFGSWLSRISLIERRQ